MSLLGSLGGAVARNAAPKVTGQAVRDILERALDGLGPVGGAARSADAQLRKSGGNVEAAIDALITWHVRLAGAQGFLTNFGGLLTTVVSVPANVAAVALLQCHLAAEIFHLRGYSLRSPQVRDAILVALLDGDARKSLGNDLGRAVTPEALLAATADAAQSQSIGRAVTGQLLAGAGGKRMATFAARRIPVLGGAVGGVGDALSTRRIGRDTARLPVNPEQHFTIDT